MTSTIIKVVYTGHSMRLYSQTYSERPSRPSNKGGDKEIVTNYMLKSLVKYQVVFKGDLLAVYDEDEKCILEHRYDPKNGYTFPEANH